MTSSVEHQEITNQSSVEDWPVLEKSKLTQTEVEIKCDKSDSLVNTKVISKRKWGKLNVDFKYTSTDNTSNRPNSIGDAQLENKENFQQRSAQRNVPRGYQQRVNNNNHISDRDQLKEFPVPVIVDTESPDKNLGRPPRQFNKKYNGYRNDNQIDVTNRNSDSDATKPLQKSPRNAAGTRGKRNYVNRGRNPARFNSNKQNGNVDFMSMYSNYGPTTIPMMMAPYNHVQDISAGLMTTVSAGSLYNNQILFLPSIVTHNMAHNSEFPQMVPMSNDMLHYVSDNSADETTDPLLKQIEYYFSDTNLRNDMYLRSMMDADGWVSLLVIAGFKRIANFSLDVNNIAQSLVKSNKLEVDVPNLKVRLADNRASWILTNKLKDQLANLNPHAPEFVPQNENMDLLDDLNATSQEDMSFAFSSEQKSLNSAGQRTLTSQERGRLALQAKLNAKQRGRQRLNSSIMSEDDVDDNMLPYLVVITPESPEYGDSNIKNSDKTRNRAVHANISKPVSDKHPGGDRQPFYIIRSKMNSELAEVIKLGLQEYEDDFLSTNDISKTSRSRLSSTSETKVNVISQGDFETLSQRLTELQMPTNESTNTPAPPPPSVSATYGTSIPVPETLFGPCAPVGPTLIGIPASNNSLFTPGTYMYFPPVAAGQPAHLTLVPQIPLSVSICNQPLAGNSSLPPQTTASTLKDFTGVHPLKSILKLKPDGAVNKPSARHIAGFYPAGSDRYKTIQQPKRRHRLYSEGENLQLETHVGFAFDTKESRSRTTSVSSETDHSGKESSSFGLRNHKSHAMLKANGFTLQGYNKFHAYALNDRQTNGIGFSQEMNTLYRFWSFFLRENFNRSMFREFRALAFEDADKNARYGLECLFRFYSYGMEFRFRKSLFKNFEEDTLKDFNTYNHKYGLEKFWAFLHYSKQTVEINSQLSDLLKQYKTLEDIRADFIPPDGFFIARNRLRSSSEMSSN